MAEAKPTHAVPVHAIAVDLAVVLVTFGSAPPTGAKTLAVVTYSIVTARFGAILNPRAVHASEPAFAFAARTTATWVHNVRAGATSTVSGRYLNVTVYSSPSRVTLALPDFYRGLVRNRRGNADNEAVSVGPAMATQVTASS